ncbi:hypothetical protein GCM10009779_45990 [Polymorphospora rubra]|uniref:Uncharacterized protein n=1 Tax=Polymorphospora rubra TaxID=338584 RepID=A0A810MSY9_9ACTN|nr:hypothetical protein Prubr_06310 [Polymorphospora rubra]
MVDHHLGSAADAGSRRNTEVQRLADRLLPEPPHVERGRVAERSPVGEIGDRGAVGQAPVEACQHGRPGFVAVDRTGQECRVQVDAREHPAQLTGTAGAVQAPGRDDLAGLGAADQTPAPVHEQPEFRMHAVDRATDGWPKTAAFLRLWTTARRVCGRRR